MRLLTLATLLTVTSFATAQQSGRSFHRQRHLPATPAASTTVEAAHGRSVVAPLQQLHSGRAWPRHHFRRLPAPQVVTSPAAGGQPVEAAAPKARTNSRGFWRPRG